MLETLAALHRALSEETRLRIVHLLAELGELCVCEIEAALRISQSRASRHLATLKQAGLVADRREGTWVHYRLRDDLDGPRAAAVEALVEALRGEGTVAGDLARAREGRRGRCSEPPSSRGGRGGGA